MLVGEKSILDYCTQLKVKGVKVYPGRQTKSNCAFSFSGSQAELLDKLGQWCSLVGPGSGSTVYTLQVFPRGLPNQEVLEDELEKPGSPRSFFVMPCQLSGGMAMQHPGHYYQQSPYPTPDLKEMEDRIRKEIELKMELEDLREMIKEKSANNELFQEQALKFFQYLQPLLNKQPARPRAGVALAGIDSTVDGELDNKKRIHLALKNCLKVDAPGTISALEKLGHIAATNPDKFRIYLSAVQGLAL